MNKYYDETNKESIVSYAKKLENHCLKEKAINEYSLTGGKGKLGQLIEKYYFGYENNSRQEADFEKVGLELKVTPIKEIKKGKKTLRIIDKKGFRAKERIVLTIINFFNICDETWEKATLRKKINLLLIFYLSNKEVPVDEQLIYLVNTWSPSVEDLIEIKNDWEKIQEKILLGKANEISEGDTMYLGACTKGANRDSSYRAQPFSDEKARQRAFSLKRSYVDSILEELLQSKKQLTPVQKQVPFEKTIEKIKIDIKGKSLEKIKREFKLDRERNSKNYLNLISQDFIEKDFGRKIKEIKEFDKANIKLKCILLNKNDVPKEHISFEQIQFKRIIEEEWEVSEIHEKFQNKKFLFFVYKTNIEYKNQKDLKDSDIYIKDVILWNMPITDLETHYKELWEDTVNKIKNNIYDDFLKAKDNPVGHIRPKARNSEDLMETPQGTYEKKKSFWLNKEYIAEQIKKKS